MLLKNEIRKAICLTIFALFFVIGSHRSYALVRSSNDRSIVSSTAVDSICFPMGTGDNTDLTSFTMVFANNCGSDVPISNPLRIYQFDNANPQYTGTYSCNYWTGNCRSMGLWGGISVVPADRYVGGKITSSTDPNAFVWITQAVSSGSYPTHFDPSEYYLGCFMASNWGNALKVVGASSGAGYFDNSTSYGRVDVFGNHNGYYQYQLSDVKLPSYALNGETDIPTFLVSGSETPNLIDNTISVDLSGDLKLVGENYKATIKVMQNCTRSGYASYNNGNSPVVQIMVDANECLANSHVFESTPNYYEGALYCADPENSHWKADRVALPHPAYYSCTYPVSYCIYEQNCGYQNGVWFCEMNNKIKCGDLPTITLGTNTGGAGANIPEPTCTTLDVGCWIVWLGARIQNIFLGLFSFAGIDYNNITLAKDELGKRVPFSYANSIFAMDWSTPITSGTTPPTLVFAFATGGSYAFVPTLPLNSALGLIRPIVEVLLWLTLIVYIITRVRSLVLSL